MQDLKFTYQTTRHETAGHENTGHENAKTTCYGFKAINLCQLRTMRRDID